jgi:3-oxoadipate enol-lactonase
MAIGASGAQRITVRGNAVEYRQLGQGADFVLLHSLLTDMSAFALIEPALAAGRRLTLINLPGYGGSGGIQALSVKAYADHVVEVLDALQLPASVDLFGNGFGGFVAASLAAHRGARIRRLVIANALVSFTPAAKAPFHAMADRVETVGMSAVLDAAIARMFPPQFTAAQPALVVERRAALAGVDAASFARACRALASLDLSPALGAISNRTLVAAGALDATTPPDEAARLAGGIRGAAFRVLPGCGHCPMLETPAALNGLIEEFLSAR